MGRAPCCDKANVKKGPWSPEEDRKLKEYIEKHGTGGNWIALPHKAGLRRCGKSCRLRWLNYLRPNIKHGDFSDDEDRIICNLFASIGSRWSIIAAQLPGRTDNDIKNYWNTKLKKKLMGLPPTQRKPNQQKQLFFPPPPPPPPHHLDTTTAAFSLPPTMEGLAIASPYSLLGASAVQGKASGSGSLLVFGGDQMIGYGRQQPQCMDFELCNISNGSSTTTTTAGGGFDSFLFGGFEDAQKLLFGGHHQQRPLDHYYSTAASASPAYDDHYDMKPVLVGSGHSTVAAAASPGCNLFYSDEPAGSAASLKNGGQGRFLY